MTREIRVRTWLIIAGVALLLTGCGAASPGVKLGEQFTLRPGEKVNVAGTDLIVKLDGVGHQTYSGQQSERGPASFVELTITGGGAPPRSISVDDHVSVGDYVITVKSANPFRSDNGPSCELVITRR